MPVLGACSLVGSCVILFRCLHEVAIGWNCLCSSNRAVFSRPVDGCSDKGCGGIVHCDDDDDNDDSDSDDKDRSGKSASDDDSASDAGSDNDSDDNCDGDDCTLQAF